MYVEMYQAREVNCLCVLGVSHQAREVNCLCVLGVSDFVSVFTIFYWILEITFPTV